MASLRRRVLPIVSESAINSSVSNIAARPAKLLSAGWKVAGLVGAVAQTITTIFGIKQIRHAYYELFYSSHVVLIL